MAQPDEAKRPKVGVGVFVLKDGKFLMGKRIGEHGKGTWGLCGGHLEFGETWREGAEREAKEEAGISITNVRFLTVTNDIFPGGDKHYITIWLACDWLSGEVVINEPEITIDYGWFGFDDMPSPLFLPLNNLDKELVRKMLQ